jgi:hypothetical protein
MLLVFTGLMVRWVNCDGMKWTIGGWTSMNGGMKALEYCPYDQDLLDWDEIPKTLEELCPLDASSRTSLLQF